jgi:hypothetical protein
VRIENSTHNQKQPMVVGSVLAFKAEKRLVACASFAYLHTCVVGEQVSLCRWADPRGDSGEACSLVSFIETVSVPHA